MPSKNTNKVDLFDFLNKVSKSDISYLASLSNEDKKSLAPLIVMRWLSGVSDKKQIQYLNNFVNPLVFNMYHHSDLLFKLMMASCTDGSKRFKWIKNKPNRKNALSVSIISQYYKCSEREAREYFKLLSQTDIIEMANELGETQDIIGKLNKE